MAPKNKKGKKKNALKKGTKPYYEKKLLDLNRDLAAEWSKVVPIENLKRDLEEKLEKTIEDFKDIKSYLEYEIKGEEKKTEKLDEILNPLELKKNNLTYRYNEILEALNERYNKELMGQEQDISDAKITLKILQPFQIQYREYLERESKLAQEEKQQSKEHSENVYHKHRKMLLDEAKLRQEMDQKIQELVTPLQQIIMPIRREEMIKFAKRENQSLNKKFMCASEKYLKSLSAYKILTQEERDVILNCSLTEEMVQMLKKPKKTAKKVDKAVMVMKNVDNETRVVETLDQEEAHVTQNSWSDDNPWSVAELLEEIEQMAKAAINVTADTESKDSSWEEVQKEESTVICEMYEKRRDLIEAMAERITTFTNENAMGKPQEKAKKHKVICGMEPKNRLILERSHFYRMLKQPKERDIAVLHKQAKIPIFDC